MNKHCEAYQEYAWSTLGFKYSEKDNWDNDITVGFNIGAVAHEAKCPLCHHLLDSESVSNCGFYRCEYALRG